MKNIITILILLFVISYSAYSKEQKAGKKIPVECIYSALSANFKINCIEQTDTSTNIFINCSTVPGRTVYVPSDLYLVDRKHKHYRMLSTDAIVSGKSKQCPLSGELQYVVSFEPLDDVTESFDMLSLASDVQTYAFWGIHSKKLKYKPVKDKYFNFVDSTLLAIDNVVIKGQFLNISPSLLPDSFRLKNNVLHHELEKDSLESRYWRKINQDGSFEIQTVVDGVSWSYIDLPGYNIPVMLYPGDTLYLTIDNCAPNVYHTKYHSKNGNEMYTNLMQADPQLMNPLFRKEGEREPARLDELTAMFRAERKNLSALLSYLVFQYQLSGVEAHLLRLSLENEANKYYLRRLSKTVDVCYRQIVQNQIRKNGEYPQEIIQDVKKDLAFLKDYNFGDLSCYLIPDKESILILNDMPLVDAVMSMFPEHMHLIRPMLKDLIGEELPIFWLNGLCKKYPEYRKFLESQ